MTLNNSSKAAIALMAILGCVSVWRYYEPAPWTPTELGQIRSLSLHRLAELPDDPTNWVDTDPRAQAFGHRLFFDTRLSGNGAIACATCHQPQQRFTDGLPLSRGLGITQRNAPSIVGLAYSPWLYWDGRKDSLWSQALAPLEHPNEHGGSRLQYAHLVANDAVYRRAYEALFGPLPDLTDSTRFPAAGGPVTEPHLAAAWHGMSPDDRDQVTRVFVNLGKSIAAYERLQRPSPSRFDRYATALEKGDADASQFLTTSERRGLRLFIGEANCTQCHNGPLFTNNSFHNTGVISAPARVPDKGRISGVREAKADALNCLGRYSDDRSGCAELEFAKTGPELLGAFRTPSLRNLAATAPYAHAGQQPDLDAVLAHYNAAPDAMIGHNEAKPLDLWPWQLDQLKAFLETLEAPIGVDDKWLRAPE